MCDFNDSTDNRASVETHLSIPRSVWTLFPSLRLSSVNVRRRLFLNIVFPVGSMVVDYIVRNVKQRRWAFALFSVTAAGVYITGRYLYKLLGSDSENFYNLVANTTEVEESARDSQLTDLENNQLVLCSETENSISLADNITEGDEDIATDPWPLERLQNEQWLWCLVNQKEDNTTEIDQEESVIDCHPIVEFHTPVWCSNFFSQPFHKLADTKVDKEESTGNPWSKPIWCSDRQDSPNLADNTSEIDKESVIGPLQIIDSLSDPLVKIQPNDYRWKAVGCELVNSSGQKSETAPPIPSTCERLYELFPTSPGNMSSNILNTKIPDAYLEHWSWYPDKNTTNIPLKNLEKKKRKRRCKKRKGKNVCILPPK